MVTEEAVYTADMPWSHSTPMDSREPMRPGKTATVRAGPGRMGRSSTPVWVETMVEPSGRVTVSGRVVGVTSRRIDMSEHDM